ncbi:MAG: peptidylprolyl isomerase [Myxococcales bacterium]|jgi:peptidyl-prolyl cis-trans isomerase D
MLDTLRKNSKSALIYIFFGIIIVVFVFSFGPGSDGCRSGALVGGGGNAATVNGKTISVSDFEQTYGRVYRDYQARAGGSFNEEIAASIGLKDKVLDQLIERELLAQAAADNGITVTDEELAGEIYGMAAFQADGEFDQEQYKLIVERQLGTTTTQFERDLRRDLLAQKMLGSLSGAAKVSDDEVRAEYTREREKLDLSFVRFSPHAFKAEVAEPTDAQIDELLKTDMAKVEEHYKSNSYRFNKPKRVKARHILVKLDEKAPDADVEAATKKLNDLKQQVSGGADFGALAKEHSEDPGSKEKGGDLGIFGPGTMDPAFEKAAFAIEAGQMSELVRTRFGLHLIKVEEVLPEERRTLDDAKRELASELLVQEAAKALAKKKAEKTLAQVKEGKKLEELWPAEEKKDEPQQAMRFEIGGSKPKVETTGLFSPTGDYIPRVGVDAALSADALALDEKKPAADKVYEINGNFVAVVLKERQRADLSELTAKMDEYRGKARDRKLGEVIDGYLKSLKERADIEKNQAVLGPGSLLDQREVETG